MLAYNPKSVTDHAADQAMLSQVAALSQHARLFYSQAASCMADNNIRRHLTALVMLHQQAEQLVSGKPDKQTHNVEHSIICQWYQHHHAGCNADNISWLAELPAQLRRQLALFKRYSRELTRPANAKAMANLAAGLQMLTDQLQPLLTADNL
ncbi:hypothetical protein WG68_00370 [Arsukibacterium ikkense]|uniref:DUF2383 domain-containing protein n=1 Tax=Arsukibacterium ikkense TaxID=336831 RepID=A0A0M2V8I8_9GAMM|nr:hypothetical protein [Arsukibacterium ikkense]KKO47147.1 hypothetical protein WG68_00370 [Arsukibacterium ikkense]